MNNIVAECVQAQKKTWKTEHVRRKNFAELKKHAHFQNGSTNNIVAECVQAQKKNVEKCAPVEKKRRRVKKNMRLFKIEE